MAGRAFGILSFQRLNSNSFLVVSLDAVMRVLAIVFLAKKREAIVAMHQSPSKPQKTSLLYLILISSTSIVACVDFNFLATRTLLSLRLLAGKRLC